MNRALLVPLALCPAVAALAFGSGALQAPATSEDPRPAEMPADPFLIGAAGAPVSLFGPEDQPRFEQVFTELQQAGFDVFFPGFTTRETDAEERTAGHADYFFDLDPDSPRFAGGPHSPYRAARGRLKILLPAFVFVPDEEWATEVDEESLRRTLVRFRQECLEGDDTVLAGLDNFDEPASITTFARFFPGYKAPVSYASVHKVSQILKSVFPHTPVFLVEGAVPWVIDHYPDFVATRLPRQAMKEEFWRGVDETVEAGDWYGFDLYPVGKTGSLTAVGDYVREAVKRAPGRKILAVLQGFGEDDLGRSGLGSRPTWEETRLMAYDAIINGADGIIWWGQSAMDISQDRRLWDAIKATAREIRALSPVLHLPSVTLSHANPRVEVLARQAEDAVYVIAANTSTGREIFSFLIPTPPTAGKTSYQILSHPGRELRSSGDLSRESSFADDLAPYEVRIYLIQYI